jgi:Lrp/AsnC family leucine-responsive transcriptional regulator
VVEADALEGDCRFVAAQVFCTFNLGRPMVCRKRVKRLEDTGIVTGYIAVLAVERVGLPPTAYLNVRLDKHTGRHRRNPMDLFRAAVQT